MTTTHNVRSAHGTVHRFTDGRVYTFRGMRAENAHGSRFGKADCGAITSGAARVTDEPINCAKCQAAH
jgi:hypothetical protein